MKLVLLSILAVALLLFGCTAPSAPSQPAANGTIPPEQQGQTGALVGNDRDAHGCIGSAGYSWCEAKQKCIRAWEEDCLAQHYTCSLQLVPSSINADDSTDLQYAVSSAGGVNFTYDCGNEKREISTGGLSTGSYLCHYGTPGTYNVSIYANGKPCASQILTVKTPEQSHLTANCYIDNSTIVRTVGPNYYYSATVRFTGFVVNDTLLVECGRTKLTSRLGSGAFGGMSTSEEVYCDYGTRVPEVDSIKISVAGVPCGSISTR
ncbi:Uncharacterised protein [uncultured archaeon]|nr:Uncharacterised protein [uncultured archaeon]